jgi:hypothetical protein
MYKINLNNNNNRKYQQWIHSFTTCLDPPLDLSVSKPFENPKHKEFGKYYR